MKIFFYLIIAITFIFLSCKKNDFITSPGAVINFSKDTLKFDTVFASVGSVTQSFKIINNNNQKILLSQVKLIGGLNSSYKTNIDGQATPEMFNLEIPGNDSIYVFVTLNVDPTSANLPFIIRDSILINYNNNNRFIQLEGLGQNAVFLRNDTISTNTTWSNTLPYVILDGLSVSENATLTIPAGTKIYFHANAPMIINGILNVQGEHLNTVLFTGDRLDEYYRDLPGSWPGLYFSQTSKNNKIVFAEIKNSLVGVSCVASTINAVPQIVIEQTKIDNAYDAGIDLQSTSANVSNSLITNCGTNIRIREGGDYNFTFCTVASYSSQYLFRTNPVLSVFNFNNDATVTKNLNANFTNSIFYGGGGIVENEIEVLKQGINDFNVTFDHCIYKAVSNPQNANFTSCFLNEDPQFNLINTLNMEYDFHITNGPAIDNGTPTLFTKDLDDNPRAVGLPDIGAYEKQ